MESHRYTVLVVDNNPLDRSAICRSLEGLGYTVVEAEGGRQAMEILHNPAVSIDTILVDLVMPGMDGFELLSEMKADSVLRSIPVIVVSAADDMGNVLRSIDKGAVAHLSKPVETEVLHSQVKTALASKQEQAAQRQGSAPGSDGAPGDGPEMAEEDEEESGSIAEFGRSLLSLTRPYWKWKQLPLYLFIVLFGEVVGAAPPGHLVDHGLRPDSPRPATPHSDPGGDSGRRDRIYRTVRLRRLSLCP
jgi:CheY-like chemotaxis protein